MIKQSWAIVLALMALAGRAGGVGMALGSEATTSDIYYRTLSSPIAADNLTILIFTDDGRASDGLGPGLSPSRGSHHSQSHG